MKPQNLLKEYYTLLKKGLIGERDTPFNPEFIKSGYSKIMLKRYEIASSICDGRVVLDVGCGLGWGVDIVKNTASKVYGIDSDQETIRYCNGKYPHNNVHFQVMDCRDLTFQENTFDAVLLMEVIEHFTLEDGYKGINEIVKVLKPAGILTGTTYIPQTDREKEAHIKQTDNEHHLHIYTRSEMEKLLSTFFYSYEIKGVSFFAAAFPKKVEKSTDSVAVNLVIKEKKKKHIFLTTSAAPSQSLFSTTEKRPPIGISKDVLPEKIFLLTVGCINYDCNINFYDPLEKICSNIINYNYVERLWQIGKKAMNDEVVSLVDKEKPDYVFFITYQDQIDIFTLDKIKMLGAKTIAWFCDDHWRFDNYSKFIAPHVFCSITTDKYAVKKYKELGLNVIKTQWASNQNYYKKVDSKFLYDVSFVGQDYGKRRENLTYLMNKGIPLSIFGKGFGKFLEFDDIIKLFNASRINLNFSGSSADNRIKQIKGRVFEVPMCGGFLLTEYADEIEKYFNIDKEVVCFEDCREANEKIQYYLKHEDRRLEIAENGYVRALKDHTWEKRLQDIFNDLESMQERSGASRKTYRKQREKIDIIKKKVVCKSCIPSRKKYEIGFHGDSYLLNTIDHVLTICEAFIETGAYMGDTLEYVARSFGHLNIFSCEPKLEHFMVAKNKLCSFLKNITLEQAVSPDFLYKIINSHPDLVDKNVAFWLDAHSFGFKWPLKEEIKYITENFKRAYIFIDDFKIPGRPDFQYDSYANQECSWEFIRDELCSNKEYSIYLPKYREKTSRHHPLVGWVLIEFGHLEEDLPSSLRDFVIRTSYQEMSADIKSRQNKAANRKIPFSGEDNYTNALDIGSSAINISGYGEKQDNKKVVHIIKSKQHIAKKNKKHVLLVTSAAPGQSPFSTTEKRPPIGIGFLISVLKNAGHNVFFIDNYLKPSSFLETDYLSKNDIDYVGIYANTICYRDTLRMLYKLEWLRQIGRWKGKIIVGGPHATVCLDTIPDFVDHIVQGEGERAILDIVEGRVAKRVVKYPRIKDLDKLPMPAWDYFVNLPYNWGGEWFPQKPVFTMNTSRGCPFRCTFCSVGSIWGKEYTCFSAERIVSDIEYLIEHYGAKGIYFREDNFTLNKKRLKRFCNLLLEKGIEISWACETRVNTLDKEIIELMSRAGACGFYFGVESGSQRVLDFMKKDITVEQTRNAFKLCYEFGIKTAASVVVGVPTETEAEINQTITLLKEIKPTVTWFNVFVGIPDSELYQYTIKNKLHEFIDDRGLVYLKEHNKRVKKFYGGTWDADIPVSLNKNEPANLQISVVMSVYNGEKHLQEAIESVLRQTYQDYEFIIVDDASNDKTNEILESFDDPRIKVIKNFENQGLTKSLNRGIKAAKGKYLARMDADDISLPHRFEIQVEFLERNPDCAVTGSSYYQIDDRGKTCSFIEVLTDDSDIKEGLKTQNWFGHGSVMMQKGAFLRAGGYNEKYKFAQDYDLWLRLAAEYQLSNIKEPLYCWRVSSSSISKQMSSEQRHYANLAISEAQKREAEKMGAPLVSVIVPTYNRPEMLTEALESILKQTFNNFEIVVVNDAGMSVEEVVLKLNKKKNISYVFHAGNRGLAAARNTGIKVARGKYIALLDDDDLFYPDHLETAMTHVSEETPVIYTDAARVTYEKNKDSYRLVGKKVPYSIDFERSKLLVGNIAPVNCFVFEKEKALQAGLFDETLTTLEDWDFWIRLSGLSSFKHIAKVTVQVNWRTDGTTMTSSRGAEFGKNRDRIYKRYQEQINQIPDIEPILEEFDKIWKEDNNPVSTLVSIVILVCNQITYTKKCIESIIKNTEVPFELIIVDNASTDGTADYLESELTQLIPEERLRIITNKKNLGFAKGNNQGIAASRAGYVMLLNNDVVVTPGWLSKMMVCAEKSPMTGIVGPKSNCVSGPQLVEKVSYDTSNLSGLEIFASEFAKSYSGKTTPFIRLVGFCMLIKRAVINKIGGLDGRYGLGNFEDNDFCLRAFLAGYQLYIAEDCFVHHFGNRTFIGEQIDYRESLNQNWEIFKKKWGIPKDLPYGSSYDFTNIAKDGFIYSKHYSPFEEESDLQVTKQETTPQVVSNPVEDKYHEIQELSVKGKNKEAKEALEQLLVTHPDFAPAHNDLGVLYFQDGDKDRALKHYERAVALQPVNITFIKNLADFYFVELGRVEDALKLYNKALYINPKDIEILLIIGHICVSLKKFDDAKVFYNKVLQIDPLNADARQMLDKLLNHEQGINQNGQISIIIPISGRQKNIENCLESIEKHTLESYEIIFVDNGSSKGTLKWLKSCINKNSNYQMVKCPKDANVAGIYNEGIKASKGEYILLLSNDVVVTRKWLSNMLECMKNTPDVGVVGPMSNISRGLQKVTTAENISINQLDEFAESFMAKNCHRRISSISIDGFCLLFGRDLVEKIGLFDEQFGSCGFEDEDFCLRAVLEGRKNYIAGDVYIHQEGRKVTSKTKKYFNAKWNKADAQSPSGKRFLTLKAIERGKEAYQKGHTENAVEMLFEGIKLSPDDKQSYYTLAEILLNAKKYKDAIDVLNEMSPDDKDVRKLELMGNCKEGMDLDKEALYHADCVLSINNNSAVAYNLKGILAFKQGDNSSAKDYFARAVESDPCYGEPHTNLGAILWDKNPDKALDLFEKGFILSPTSQDIITNYHSAITESGEFKRAELVFEEACFLYPNNKMIKYQLIDMLIQQQKNANAMHQIEEAIALFGVDDGILSAALRIRDLLGPKEVGKSKDKKNTVSLCMIVKNEQEHLAKCLKSVKSVVDEMIVVDTGSTDRTKEIAKVFGAKVYEYEWSDNFAEARNFSISKACGSWTFHLDADEVISDLDYEVFKKMTRQPASKQVAFLFHTRNYTMDVGRVGWTPNDGKYVKEESGTGWTLSEKVRLFRRDQCIRFEYPVHELVEPSLKKAKVALKKCTIPIHHYGTLNKGKSADKSEVYYRMGLKKLDEMGDDTVALPALREMAIQAEILGKHDKAIELWERFIAIEPHVPEAFINMGIAYCSLGKFEDVLETAKKAMALAPEMKEAHYNYALGKLNTGNSGEAVSVLEKLLERLGEYLPARFILAAAYCCKGEKGKGIKILEHLKKTSIGEGLPIRCHDLAKGFVSSHRYDYALGILDAAIESKNSNKNVLELYAQCLKVTENNEKKGTSKITFRENIKSTVNKIDPGDKVIAMDMVKQANELNQKGQTDDAIETVLKAIGYFPDDKGPYYALAEILINAKKYQDAIEVLNEMPPDEKDAKKLELTGYCKEGMKLYDEAQNYADQALSLNRSSAPALNLKGILAYSQGDHRKAKDFFKQAVESDPGYGEAYTNLGAIHWDKNRDEALNMFEKGFILSPLVTDVVTNYHTAVSALGKFERAEQVFKQVGSLHPDNKMIKYQLIDVFIKQEKNADAMHQIEEAIALFGVDDGILSAALKIRDLLGPKKIEKKKDKKNTVSLCMIVKNEERYLAKCLRSVKPVVDEMIIVDTGSTDRTKEIGKVFGAKVYDYKWADDFSKARNFSISKASGKWNLILDADEAISSLDYNKFKRIIEGSKPFAYQFTTRNYTLLFNMLGWNANDGGYVNENAGVGWTPSDKVRLFPSKPGVRFEYPIHELLEPSLKKAGLEVKKCKIPIHHYGRLDQEESDKKGEIYYQIGRKKLNEMKDNANALLELAVQAGILGKYEESIELWERFINMKPKIPMAFVNMGAMYTKLGKYDKAVSAAAKALEIEPKMKEAHYNYAFSKVHLGQVKEAILVLEKLLCRFTEYPPAQFLLAVAYCLEAREAKWRKGFEELRLTMGAGLAVACYEFAKGLVSAKRPDYAVALLEAAIESKNSNKEIDELYSKSLEMIDADKKTGTMDL